MVEMKVKEDEKSDKNDGWVGGHERWSKTTYH